MGQTYTAKPGSVTAVNDNPEMVIVFDTDRPEGVVTSKDTLGNFTYHFSATTIKGKAVAGSDTVFIVDILPVEDATEVVALYSE